MIDWLGPLGAIGLAVFAFCLLLPVLWRLAGLVLIVAGIWYLLGDTLTAALAYWPVLIPLALLWAYEAHLRNDTRHTAKPD